MNDPSRAGSGAGSSDGPSDEEIARINAEHLISTPLRPADLLFVFGARYGVDLTDLRVESRDTRRVPHIHRVRSGS